MEKNNVKACENNCLTCLKDGTKEVYDNHSQELIVVKCKDRKPKQECA